MAAHPVYIHGATVNEILDLARSRIKDAVMTPAAFPGSAGEGQQFNEKGGGTSLSTGMNPDGSLILRTQVYFNSAWRKWQAFMANLGWRQVIGDNLIIEALPPNSNTDPAAQSWLSWNGFFDGTNFTDTPKLPQDFYAPLKIRERQSGQDAIFVPMLCSLDGLRNQMIRSLLNRQWEWRTNALYLPGATSETDLQFRYVRLMPNFPDPNYYLPNTPWYRQVVGVPDCASSLAWYVVYEAMVSVGDAAQDILLQAQGEAEFLFNNLQGRADQRTNNRRRPRGQSRRNARYGL